jgi:hypothetical protein
MSLLRTAGRAAVISATATSVSNRVSAKQHGRWAANTQPAPAASGTVQPPAPPPPVPPPADPVSQRLNQLERLAQLKAQGALTDEEFDAQKKQVLGA